MKSERTAWTFLRPLLLVVAATAAWIALSAAGASADSSPSRDLLPGAVGSAAEEVSGLADNAVQSVPVVKEVMPTGAVTAVVDPAVGTVDGIVGATVGAAVPLADTVLEPLAPVLEPVVSAVTLPAVGPDPGPGVPVFMDGSAASAPEPAPGPPPNAGLPQTPGDVAGPAQSPDILQSYGAESPLQMTRAAATPALSKASPEDVPFQTPFDVPPVVPGAAMGGSSLSGGNGPPAAGWISQHHFPAPEAGTAATQSRSLTAPAPVSFDPGSSPD